MAYLVPQEIKDYLYDGVADAISNSNDTIIQDYIDASIQEAKGYLKAFDTVSIFNATGADRNPALLLFIKDITVWHFVQRVNPNVDLGTRETNYRMAVKWLEKVQAGNVTPDFPLPAVQTDEAGNVLDPDNFVRWGSTNKRNNYIN